MRRELVVLGTASQVPTRRRNHNGYLLRWDGIGILFDPGEGTQRQCTLAGVPVSAVTHVCITHAHGDHCLGLPGVLQRRALDGLARPVVVAYPAAAEPTIDALRAAIPDAAPVEPLPVDPPPVEPGPVTTLAPGHRLTAAALSHGVPTLGWRVDEDDGWRLLPERAAAAGVHGPARAELLATGAVTVDGRTVRRDDVAVRRPGQSVAFVMDTRDGDGARALAEGVDLLVIEATFLEDQRALAEEVGHLTAGQAAAIGRDAGARRVVLTHLSQRYPDPAGHLAEARAAAPALDLVVAEDLDVVPVPARR